MNDLSFKSSILNNLSDLVLSEFLWVNKGPENLRRLCIKDCGCDRGTCLWHVENMHVASLHPRPWHPREFNSRVDERIYDRQ